MAGTDDFDEMLMQEPTEYAPEPEGNGRDSQVEVEDDAADPA